MNRRKALKILGFTTLALACNNYDNFKKANADDNIDTDGTLEADLSMLQEPFDVVFHEEGLGHIIIHRKSGKTLKFSFTEIFDALENNDG